MNADDCCVQTLINLWDNNLDRSPLSFGIEIRMHYWQMTRLCHEEMVVIYWVTEAMKKHVCFKSQLLVRSWPEGLWYQFKSERLTSCFYPRNTSSVQQSYIFHVSICLLILKIGLKGIFSTATKNLLLMEWEDGDHRKNAGEITEDHSWKQLRRQNGSSNGREIESFSDIHRTLALLRVV